MKLKEKIGVKKYHCIPVNTRRLKNVFKTSLVRYGCLKDVSETTCVHWDMFYTLCFH